MKSKDRKPGKKVHLTNFHIAGFGYWEGCEAFEQLKIGTRLDLIREEDNPFDPYAVAHPEQQVEVIVNIKNQS